MIGKIKNSGNIKKINISKVTKNQGLESSELIGILNKMNKSKQDIDDTVNIHRSIFKIIKNLKIKEEEEENLETKEEWQKVNLSFLENPALKLNETSICHHEYKRFPMLKYHMEYKFPIMVYKKNEYSFQSKLLNKASQDNKQEILFNNLENKETKAKNNIKYDLLNKSEKTKLAPFCNKKPLKYKSSHKDSIFGKISSIFKSSLKKILIIEKKLIHFLITLVNILWM
ncbi:hypothetical protein LUQ84_000458 [Hamiltosporidium tvaerminnensis]|nr:hypothetical protein LUQ84_000458 [Hamiltosporidium tvaerminnensis]